MVTKILKVVAQTEAVYVPSKKSDNGQLAKSMIRLKELGGDYEDGVTIRDAIGRDQKATFINESGLYSLILSSKLPQAGAAMAIQENGAEGMDFWAMLRGWEMARK